MADLDDFFAKKDRKKSKAKKFSTTEEVAKKLEDPKKNEKPVKKERVQDGEDGGVPQQEQDEWKDFEEEKKDYSGLKIGNLTINPNGEGNTGGSENNNEQQPHESGSEVEKKVGPWKKIETAPSEGPGPGPQEREPVEKKTEPPPIVTTGGAYVPPSLRNQPQQPVQQSRLRSKAAPDIHNEEYFPTLSGSKTERRNRNEASFEVVSHNKSSSLRHAADQTKFGGSQGPKLTLGNRYNTLSNDS